MKMRPPKPDNVSSNPRTKLRTRKRPAAVDALSRLTRAPPKREYRDDYVAELNQEKNDRGAGILIVTHIENTLQRILEKRLTIKSGQFEALFGLNAPLATFENKIRIAYALDVFDSEMRDNLMLAKAIRNAFAHSNNPINFKTKEVIEVCDLLFKPQLFGENPITITQIEYEFAAAKTPREKFLAICGAIIHNLYWYGTHAAVAATWPPVPQNPRFQSTSRPTPLP